MDEEQLALPIDNDLPIVDFDAGREDKEAKEQKKLLTISLFKEAICEAEGNEDDRLLIDFTDYVLPKLMRQLAGSTAKGGQFFERLDARGKVKRRDNAGDQSLPAHLLNGFLPTYRIAKRLQQPDVARNQVKAYCEALQLRIYVAAYILHDYEKFPDYQQWLIKQDIEGKWKHRDWVDQAPGKQDAPDLGREYIAQKIIALGLDQFLGASCREFIDDIIWISSNAGDKNDADLGLITRGLKPLEDDRMDGRIRNVLVNLVKLSDRFASIIKHPQDITKNSLTDLLNSLSNAGQFKFTYHALSDNRGVLTNIINNALMDLHPKEFYTQLLYLPDGVVYLATANAPPIAVQQISEQVINKIKTLCGDRLKQRQIGFGRDGKGLKFADYYWLFFNIAQLMDVAKLAACRIIPSTKNSSAAKRSASLTNFQADGELPNYLTVEFKDDYRIDRLAEFGDTLCRGIWRGWCDRFDAWQKQQPKAERKTLPELNLTQKLAEHLGLTHEIPAIRSIQSLKKTGGVPLDWYYLAAKYIQSNSTLDDQQVREVMTAMVSFAADAVEAIVQEFTLPDGWDDLRTYVQQIVSLPTGTIVPPQTDPFLVELSRYQAAKVTGRGRENVCAMSSSSYTVTEQMESATLFTPQVYSNRQILFNAQAAKRQICAIWSVEIMLRQILMNQTNATGGDFEGRKYRYLYLYPAYFFTPETNTFIQKVYSWIRRTRFDADIRKHLVTDQQVAQLNLENYQQVDSLLIQAESDRDQTFKLNYPNEPMTFFFMALPPGRDATDTESWVMPAWLAFALPLVLDVKVVASESPVPPFISGADFEHTTVLDGEHQAITTLVKKEQYRLDAILPRTTEIFSPLNALSAAYCIHLEVNRKKDGDPDWGKLAALARDLETSPLYVFHYLTKLVRKLDWDSAPISKIKLYLDFYHCFDPQGDDVNQLRELTRLYRRFYRAKSQYAKPNAVLKPIDEAADVILKVDKALVPDDQALTDVVAARISKLMTNVRRRTAEGKPTLAFVDGKWKPALTVEEERQAIYEFAQFFVKDLFRETFKSDRARLAGMQLNLIRDTCDYLYRLTDDEERKAQNQPEPEDIPELETEDAA
ncbi:type I-D CRISPR-associated protein Cas10d/Csc3 [Thermocoleostomius sinensis]|uniref:Type I-D CRISPR-associated protein Cas10d/Csc3 n=1 Tax=Thermocoleostomius sinensis A174 TaxID=2016057 RepID=A0A9E9C7D1_9CYAN|nr:type I-D CRISPR-associated protein Cas10d/Csc3 [Thermocoleostomius sinensis]WAL59118.1 type I-D CRISPR-associated protein Cas10d/Csc3 [Thermocoleostomius sinensis A174]